MTILDTTIYEQSSIIRAFIVDSEKQGFGPAIVWIYGNASTDRFAGSLFNYLQRNGGLSLKQLQAAMRNVQPVTVDTRSDNFQKLFKAFDSAVKASLEKLKEREKKAGRKLSMTNPIFRAGVEGDTHGVRLTMAGPNAKPHNKGCLYVTEDAPWEDREYLGKITPKGEFLPTLAASDLHRKAVDLVADDPWQAALTYGRAMGKCSMCGRKLTADKSIDDGIGPVCKSNWGL